MNISATSVYSIDSQKEPFVPVKKAKENVTSNFSGNSIYHSQGWCSIGISLGLV